MMAEFHFIRPLLLLAMLPAALVLLGLMRRHDPTRAWRRVIASHLLPYLLDEGSAKRGVKPHALLGVVLFLSILALAGPTWEREPSPFVDDTAALVIVLELTPTMLAQDIQPSRLERATHKIKELVEARRGSRTALVAHAGSAHLVMPLTRDGELIAGFAAALSPAIMPMEGEATAEAIALGRRQLQEAQVQGSILLITDGVPPSQIEKIKEARELGGAKVHVFAVAADESVAAPLDSPPAPPLNIGNLEATARAGGGRLIVITPDPADVERLARIVATDFSPAPGGAGEAERWKDSGYLLVPVVALCALFWFRPGWSVRWTATFLCAGLLLQPCGSAGAEENGSVPELSSMQLRFLSDDQQAQWLFDQGAFEQAAGVFTEPDRRGVAWFRAGEFKRAAAEFGRSETEAGAYNRGNALVMLGQYEKAIESYETALRTRPDWEAAGTNLAIAKARLRALAPPEDDAGGTGGKLEADEIVFDDRAAKNPSAERVEVAGLGDELSDEDLRSLWLRRVETKPATFLRSKFAYQRAMREAAHEAGD